jgi:YD repeat-containing protein
MIGRESGNVFADLGLPNAEELLAKSMLAHQLAGSSRSAVSLRLRPRTSSASISRTSPRWYAANCRVCPRSGSSDPAGQNTSLLYSTNGKLDYIITPGTTAGRLTDVYHDGNKLVFVGGPESSTEYFSYNAGAYEGLMSSSQATTGAVTSYGYTATRQPYLIVQPAMAIADSAQAVSSTLIQVSLPATVYPNLVSGEGIPNKPAPFRLAANSAPYTHDARNQPTNYGVDRFGAPTIIARGFAPPGGGWVHQVTEIERNQHSQPTRIITPRGDNTQYFWTREMLDSTRNNHSGQRIRYEYDLGHYNNLKRVYGDVPEVTNTWSNDGKELLSTRVGPDGPVPVRTTYGYDSYGRVTGITDALNNITSRWYGLYNSFGNLDEEVTGPRTVKYGYDGYGRVRSTTDPVGDSVKYDYDLRNRPRNTVYKAYGVSPDTTKYDYDSTGLIRSVTDANHQVYLTTYNALGWVTGTIDPNALADTYAYDLNGNIKRWTNRRGQTTSFNYDGLDNLTSRNAAGIITTYETDSAGIGRYRATTTSASSDKIYTNIHGQDSLAISTRGGVAYSVLSLYDIQGRRKKQDVLAPAGGDSITYGYDPTYGRLTSMRTLHGTGLFVTFDYNQVESAQNDHVPDNAVAGGVHTNNILLYRSAGVHEPECRDRHTAAALRARRERSRSAAMELRAAGHEGVYLRARQTHQTD